MKNTLFVYVACLVLCACGTVKVGDISFKDSEICSKEYARTYFGLSNIKRGCMPPQRFSGTQEFFFDRERPLIKEVEVQKINTKAAATQEALNFNPLRALQLQKNVETLEVFSRNIDETDIDKATKDSKKAEIALFKSAVETAKLPAFDARVGAILGTGAGSGVNVANISPSFIGRIFKLNDQGKVPETGHITYPPLNYDINAIETRVLVSTELDGSEEIKKRAAVAIDVNQLVTTLVTPTPQNKALIESLTKNLGNVTTSYDRSEQANNFSLGKYQYVTIEHNTLDQLIQELQYKCLIPVDKQKETCAQPQSPKVDKLAGYNQITDYVLSIQSRLDEYKNNIKKKDSKAALPERYGLIIGASIINTSGASNSCIKGDFYTGNGTSTLEEVSSCSELQARVKGAIEASLSEEKNSGDPKRVGVANTLGESLKTPMENALVSAYVSSKRIAIKNLKLNGHSSVLAISYIVIQ